MDKKNLIVEEAMKRFQQITEYILAQEGNILEAGEEGADDPNAMGGDPMGGDPMGGGDPNAMGGDPNAMGGDPMGGDPNAMGGGAGTPEGFDPQGGMDMNGGDPNAMGGDPMGGDPNAMGAEPMQPEDEVIDVDELTDSQEETEK